MTSSPLPVTLVVLDIAGTTVEEHGTVYDVLAQAAREAGSHAGPADVAAWTGAEKRGALDALLRIGADGPRGTTEDEVDAAFARFDELLAARYAAQPPTEIPGAATAFAELRKAGVKVALTTGFTRDVTRGVLDAVGWTVARMPEEQLDDAVTVDAVTCGDEVASGRPAPYLVHRSMERTGTTEVSRVLVAGDTVRDLRSGRNAGAGFVVGVRSGVLDDAGLGLERHDFVLDSVADLPRLVLG
ncbi:phosphonatase-like hydrolase [Luteimicrobium sp. DT211]|uniref:phosphonatase-like hydrolase n=1 Tax=Luteimicrobium sp. DT211 TaxID=3393412 RepID=UPI003CF8D287